MTALLEALGFRPPGNEENGERPRLKFLRQESEPSGDGLPPDELRRYREVMHRENHPPISRHRVQELDRIFGYGESGKIVYSRHAIADIVPEQLPGNFDFSSAVLESLKNRALVSEKGYHMTVCGPMGDLFAREGRKLAHRAMDALGKTNGRKKPETLELFTGLGSLTSSLHRGGHHIEWTVDNNTEIMLMAQHNWEALGFGGHLNWALKEALTFVSEMQAFGRDFDIVYADPEWEERLHEQKAKPFSFSMMKPDGAEVVMHSLQVAPIVGLKSRIDMDFQKVERLAGKLGAKAHVVIGELPLSESRMLEEPMIFFLREDIADYVQTGGAVETLTFQRFMLD